MRSIANVLCLTLVLGSAPSWAIEPSTPPEQVTALYAQGVERFQSGRYVDALWLFRKARKSWSVDPKTLQGTNHETLASLYWNVTRCLEMLERKQDELKALDQALQILREPARIARAKARIATLEAALFGTLAVTCAATGTRVEFGPDKTTDCPHRLHRVRPVQRSVHASFDGWPFTVQDITVQVGQDAQIDFPNVGTLDVGATSDPIQINDRAVGPGPTLVKLPPGEYTVKVMGRRTREVTIAADEVTTLTWSDAPSSVVPWVVGGAGAGVAIAGAVALWASSASREDANSAQSAYDGTPDIPASAARLKQLRAQANGHDQDAQVYGVVGGVAVGVGLVAVAGALWWQWDATDTATLTPTVDPGRGAGLLWTVGF